MHCRKIMVQRKVIFLVVDVGSSQDFQGYIFKNGAYTYTLTPSTSASNFDDSQWILAVAQKRVGGNKVVFTENGISN